MRRLTVRLIVALCTFALGLTAAALWAVHNFNRAKNLPPAVSKEPQDSLGNKEVTWQKVDMNGEVVFYIPSNLRFVYKDTGYLYRAFRSNTMEFFIYQRVEREPACAIHEKALREAKPIETKVGGRMAIMENIERTSFEFDQNEPVLKGLILCVNGINNNKGGFVIVGKYKTDEDYQNLWQIIDSIKFTQDQL